jgi:hypothetical protein
MLIKVLKTTKGAKNKNGIECQEYLANQTYEMFDELAEVFISNGWGVKAIDNLEEHKIEIQEEKALDILENKAIDNLENKSIKTKKGK